MSVEQIKNEIKNIESYLSKEQLDQDIIEVNNNDLITYLESIGAREINYTTGNKPQLGKFTELGGVTNLWYKDINDTWIIKNYQIKKFFK